MAIEAQRTLVKSVPELWSELSVAEQLGPLLDGAFGEIRITRLEPESLIAWESEIASGEVVLSASGFGTRVRLTAHVAPPPAPPRGSLWERLRARWRPAPAPAPLLEDDVAQAALGSLLDDVGTARHRPFSR